jgi:hypothetical protein
VPVRAADSVACGPATSLRCGAATRSQSQKGPPIGRRPKSWEERAEEQIRLSGPSRTEGDRRLFRAVFVQEGKWLRDRFSGTARRSQFTDSRAVAFHETVTGILSLRTAVRGANRSRAPQSTWHDECDLKAEGISSLGLERAMGEVIRFVPKSELERARLIREARAIYDGIFPPDSASEQRDDIKQ